MKALAEALLAVENTLLTLSMADRQTVVSTVCRTYGFHGVKECQNTTGGDFRGGRSIRKRDPKKHQEALEILEFLNLKAGRNFRPVEENIRFIHARLNTCSVEDMKGVIARKTREWKNTDMEKHLRPATLFNATKFEQYIGEQGT